MNCHILSLSHSALDKFTLKAELDYDPIISILLLGLPYYDPQASTANQPLMNLSGMQFEPPKNIQESSNPQKDENARS